MLGDCVIIMADGKEKECREIYAGDKILTPTLAHSEIISVHIGKEECGIRIVTDSGRRVTLSKKNVLLTGQGPKLVRDIRPGDRLVSENREQQEVSHIYVDPIPEKVYRFETDQASWIYVNGVIVGDITQEKALLHNHPA